MKEIIGFSSYYYLDGKVFSKDLKVKRKFRGDYILKGTETSIRQDKNGYYRITLRDNSNTRRSLLYHRLVYAVENNISVYFEGVCCHYNDDRTNNSIGNLYVGSIKDNTKDKMIGSYLLGMYKKGKILEYLKKTGYSLG